MDERTLQIQLTKLSTMMDATIPPSMLETYLQLAEEIIRNSAFPYEDEKPEMPRRYLGVQLQIASYLLNKRGAEGQIAHSENGVSRSYTGADVPKALLNQITPHCGVII